MLFNLMIVVFSHLKDNFPKVFWFVPTFLNIPRPYKAASAKG